jgi:hypothetical protein
VAINSVPGSKSRTDGLIFLGPKNENSDTCLVVEYKKRYFNSYSFTTKKNMDDINNEDSGLEFLGVKKEAITPSIDTENENGWILELNKFNSIKKNCVSIKKEVGSNTKIRGFYINFMKDHTIVLWRMENLEEEDLNIKDLNRQTRNSGDGVSKTKKYPCALLDIEKADLVIKIEKEN